RNPIGIFQEITSLLGYFWLMFLEPQHFGWHPFSADSSQAVAQRFMSRLEYSCSLFGGPNVHPEQRSTEHFTLSIQWNQRTGCRIGTESNNLMWLDWRSFEAILYSANQR